MDEAEENAPHRRIVEDALCGLDIDQHGAQLAACDMTLGAPAADYERMNLATMPHGPQGNGSMKAGSSEILTAVDAPRRSLDALDAAQVNDSREIRFPLHDLDGVVMNPPFTNNQSAVASSPRMSSSGCRVTSSTFATACIFAIRKPEAWSRATASGPSSLRWPT